jgi:hypothetical protein
MRHGRKSTQNTRGSVFAFEAIECAMAPNDWHLPMRCTECETDRGLPFRVQSKNSGEVLVSLRCSKCGHEWIVKRATPMFAPKPDRRQDPSSA